MAGAPTGGMDQSASLRCRAGHALELDCRTGEVEQVPFDLSAAGLALLVIDTKAEHSLVDGQYGARRAACEKAARMLGVDLLADIAPDDLETHLSRLAEPAGSAGSAGSAEPAEPSPARLPPGSYLPHRASSPGHRNVSSFRRNPSYARNHRLQSSPVRRIGVPMPWYFCASAPQFPGARIFRA